MARVLESVPRFIGRPFDYHSLIFYLSFLLLLFPSFLSPFHILPLKNFLKITSLKIGIEIIELKIRLEELIYSRWNFYRLNSTLFFLITIADGILKADARSFLVKIFQYIKSNYPSWEIVRDESF